jgi:peptidoglycan/xylan/chitin deacetylase (PgdA/CDA1 family)
LLPQRNNPLQFNPSARPRQLHLAQLPSSAKYTRVQSSSFMLVSRLLLFCFAGLIVAHGLRAEPKVPTPTAGDDNLKRAAEPSITFSSVHVAGPYIAMTFDDGPSATLTPKLLDLLAARRIKATFFVIGENVAEHPDIVARAAREGHEIANHSWSHPNLAKLSDEGVRRQLWRTDDAIKSATGTRPTLLRPPYGSITKHEKRWIHDEFGYQIVLWDVDPYDWKRPGPAVVRNRILQETRPGSIVLSHDIHSGTIEAMPSTFDALEAKGFKFVTVSELIRAAAVQPARTPENSTSVRAAISLSPSPAPASSPGG